MTHDQLVKVLQLIRPGAEYVISGEPPKMLWLDKVQSVPTESELSDGLVQLHGLAYRELRAKAYPLISDQLDAIMKGGEVLENMRNQCLEVKARFPKPL